MKYAFKWKSKDGETFYAAHKRCAMWVDNINEACMFYSIPEAISWLITNYRSYVDDHTRWTLVGVQEINTPRYKEVAL